MPNIPERRSGWVFDKTINTPTIITILMIAFGGFNYFATTISNQDKRITVLESSEVMRKEQIALQAAQQAARDSEQRQQMNYLVQRMDALKDAVLKKN